MNYKRTKYACYYTYLAMSSIFCLPPVLFTVFQEMYGISYTLLGTLVLVNFCTQMVVDVLFTLFPRVLDPHITLRVMPLLTTLGLTVYALVPTLFPQHAYAGLLTGTVIFSVASGLNEVFLSPTVAALPSDDPQRDMSTLHSLYAYGVVTVVTVSTLFLKVFGGHHWMFLTLFWAALPILSCVLFCTSPLPPMDMAPAATPDTARRRNTGLVLCLGCIFLGSAAENTMTNWISSYAESALQIPKAVGDILGLTLFAVLIGLTRTWYAKQGRNITAVLLYSMLGAVMCYLVAALSPVPVLSMIACVLTGLCTSMLWPGTLILMEENIPHPGVTAYALMAAGGDLGGSVALQMLGAMVDGVAASDWAAELGVAMSVSPEQIGMKVGMLAAAVFPLLGVVLLLYIKRYFNRQTS